MGASQSSIRPAVELISLWHLDRKERLIFDSGSSEINHYFEAADKIIQSAHRDELKEFISMIVARFKSEFHIVMTRQTESAMGSASITELSTSISDNSSSYQFHYEDYVLYDAPKKFIVDYLQRIVVKTNDCGHLRVLTEVYISVRKQFVDWIIKKLRFEEFLSGDTKKFLGEDLKMKTERWVQAAKICFKLVFPREKIIAMQIFDGLGIGIGNSYADECFMHIVKDVMFNLLRFAENVISSNLNSEKLDIVLLLCNALLSLVPDVNALFQFESGRSARNTIETIQSGLQNEVRRMLLDFINAVFHDASKIIVDNAESVLPFTKYVMGYINLLVNNKILLMNVIVSKPESLTVPDVVLQELGNLRPLSFHLVLIIAVLLLNLETKSGKYKNENPLFGYELFMMNNLQFIVQKINGSNNLQEIVGPNYLRKLKKDLNNTMDQFQALACDNLLNCLKEDDLYVSRCFCSGVSIRALRKQIKKFNKICENMDAVQLSRNISDTSMREVLCRATKKTLIPAYENFLDKFKNYLKNENKSKSRIFSFRKVSIKYTVEDLNDLVMKGYQLSSSTEFLAESSRVLRD